MQVIESYAYTQARLMNDHLKRPSRHTRAVSPRRWIKRNR